MKQENQIEDKIQGIEDNEKLYVLISPLEGTIKNMPVIGKVYTKGLYKKYQKIFPEHQIILK